MNCKQGDLAIVVIRGRNTGRLVEVIRPAAYGEHPDFAPTYEPTWWVRATGAPLLGRFFGEYRERPFADGSLRPIRDNDGADETLTWAGKPEEVTA